MLKTNGGGGGAEHSDVGGGGDEDSDGGSGVENHLVVGVLKTVWLCACFWFLFSYLFITSARKVLARLISSVSRVADATPHFSSF